jgi:putative acetyltransferase
LPFLVEREKQPKTETKQPSAWDVRTEARAPRLPILPGHVARLMAMVAAIAVVQKPHCRAMMPAMTAPCILRPIRSVDDPAVQRIIHEVMTEHGCSGQGFAIHDPEVAAMSASYTGPEARYYVVSKAGEVLGGAGYARLAGSDPNDAVCELRKMYFRKQARGLGIGQALLELLLDEMRLSGYRRCYLETTSWMDKAQALYRRVGFAPQPHAEGQTGHHGCDCFFSRSL